MLDEKSPEELQRLLINSFTDINTILKALGIEQRQKLLIFLLDGPKTFQELSEHLELGRTAVANHLTQLKDVSLIDRIHHGYYRITQKGLLFLQAIYLAYEHSQTEKMKQKEAEQKKALMDGFLQRRKN